MCVCFPFSLFFLFFFDSRVFTPSRHAQITSRLKSRKIFGKIVFFRYDNNFSPFKVRIFNGLIFISYWYNSIGSFLRSLSERKKKKTIVFGSPSMHVAKTTRRSFRGARRTRKTLINANTWNRGELVQG